MTPNMANSTQKHGYMRKERLELELNIIKYMYGHMTPIPSTRMQNINNSPPMYTSIMKLPLMWPKQVL